MPWLGYFSSARLPSALKMQHAAVEDLAPVLLVEAHHLVGREERLAFRTGTREPECEDPSSRRAGDKVEELCGALAGALLELGQHERGDQSTDSAAVEGEDAKGGHAKSLRKSEAHAGG